MNSTTVHYNYNALCGGLHEIYSTACSFDLRCESVTFLAIAFCIPEKVLPFLAKRPISVLQNFLSMH